MSKANPSQRITWRAVARAVDGWLVPGAFGVFSVLVLAQIVTAVPSVRAAVDTISGRFVTTATSNSTPQADRHASIMLYLSPVPAPRPDIHVLVNGQYAGNFVAGELKLTVHSGDRLTIVAPQISGDAQVFVDDNNPYLVYPLPGMHYTLTQRQPRVVLPVIQFAP